MIEFAKIFHVAPFGEQVLVYWEHDEELNPKPWVIRIRFQVDQSNHQMAYLYRNKEEMEGMYDFLNQERLTEIYDILRGGQA